MATGAASAELEGSNKCPGGSSCAFYQAFNAYDFSQDGYHHLTALEHPMTPCRHGRACRAHARLRAGGREFKDVCHCCLYTHGRPDRAVWPDDIVPISKSEIMGGGGGAAPKAAGYGALYGDGSAETRGIFGLQGGRTDTADIMHTLETSGTDLVCGELQAHGLEHEMRLLGVVAELRRHPRLAEAQAALSPSKRYGARKASNEISSQPVLDVELLALLLYTGTDAQGKIRWAIRSKPEADVSVGGWFWTIQAIRHAVIKLSEDPPKQLHHGLNGVFIDESVLPAQVFDWKTKSCPEKPSVPSQAFGYANLISTSMSVDMATTFAKGEGGTVASAQTHGSVLSFDTTVGFTHELAYADLRWISKFPDEQEWLLVPLSTFSLPSVTEMPPRRMTVTGDGGAEMTMDYFKCAWISMSPDWFLERFVNQDPSMGPDLAWMVGQS